MWATMWSKMHKDWQHLLHRIINDEPYYRVYDNNSRPNTIFALSYLDNARLRISYGTKERSIFH